MKEKLCSSCKEVKPVNEYQNNSKARDGLTYQCKDCIKENHRFYTKKYNRRHPVRRKARASVRKAIYHGLIPNANELDCEAKLAECTGKG